MIIIETYYLVDYENVNGANLGGAGLSESDHVCIFYTNKVKKTSWELVGKLGRAEIETFEVPAGNQSVDMHISTFLGYLIGEHGVKKYRYVVVSKDKGYDRIVKFWKDRAKANVVREAKISVPSLKTKDKKASSEKAGQSIGKESKKKSVKKLSEKSQLNQDIQTAVSKEYDGKTANEVAKIVSHYYGQDSYLQRVHNHLKQYYNEEDYSEIYKIVKPVVRKYVKD